MCSCSLKVRDTSTGSAKRWAKSDDSFLTIHLITLEEFGFVDSRYEISENPKAKGKAIRKYRVTDKVKDVIEALKKKL